MVYNISEAHSLVSQWMAEIRSVEIQADRMRFRRNMERVGEVIAYEISKTLPFGTRQITTPLGSLDMTVFDEGNHPVVGTILRAGLPLHQGLLNYFDKADCAFVAAYRKHHKDGSFEIEQHYVTCPELSNRVLILADPMLATGASLIQAIEELLLYGTPSKIIIVCAIASTIGLESVARRFPEADIWTAAIDDEITAKGYIVPGLGDAGDLAFGEKKQS
ncbi:MAG: uracil phosphoribosyltransferase [Bacteroidetes bacterium 47-18]|nr:MAG: uracil phosphoribosyltransferase [Bacteroidetes bacterium 47-18]